MTNILIARLTHGRLGFAILHDVAPDWHDRMRGAEPFAFAILLPGDAEQLDLKSFAALAVTMMATPLAQIVDAWRLAREFAQPLPPLVDRGAQRAVR